MELIIYKSDFKKYPAFWERLLDLWDIEEYRNETIKLTHVVNDEELIIQLLTTEKKFDKIVITPESLAKLER